MSSSEYSRRSRNLEEPENHERWLVSYADFITLLFAFFTVLYATSQQDAEKAKQFQDSIKKYFLGFAGAGGPGSGPAPGKAPTDSPIESPIPTYPTRSEEQRQIQLQLENFIAEELSPDEVAKLIQDVADESNGVRIRIRQDSLFGNGSSELKTTGLAAVGKLGRFLRESQKKIIIESSVVGGVPGATRMSQVNTWELGSRRASKLAKYFATVHKIDAAKLLAMGRVHPRETGSGDELSIVLMSDDFSEL